MNGISKPDEDTFEMVLAIKAPTMQIAKMGLKTHFWIQSNTKTANNMDQFYLLEEGMSLTGVSEANKR